MSIIGIDVSGNIGDYPCCICAVKRFNLGQLTEARIRAQKKNVVLGRRKRIKGSDLDSVGLLKDFCKDFKAHYRIEKITKDDLASAKKKKEKYGTKNWKDKLFAKRIVSCLRPLVKPGDTVLIDNESARNMDYIYSVVKGDLIGILNSKNITVEISSQDMDIILAADWLAHAARKSYI